MALNTDQVRAPLLRVYIMIVSITRSILLDVISGKKDRKIGKDLPSEACPTRLQVEAKGKGDENVQSG